MEPVIRRRNDTRGLRRRDGLVKHARNRTSQHGEDGIIGRIFSLFPQSPTPRFCVDVGAWDGKHLSNTYSLLCSEDPSMKWKGVLIEADRERFDELRALHSPIGNTCICEVVSCEANSNSSLSRILQRNSVPKDLDFISIDVDGTDYWLLHDLFDAGWRPKVVLIEFNPTMPIDLVYIQPRSDRVRHGSSLSALVELANKKGYTLVETTLFNAFFVMNELYEDHLADEVHDTSIEALHEVTTGTELYQLYDGTVKLHGCKRMLWHRSYAIDETKLQMVPSSERGFPFAPSSNDESIHQDDSRDEQIRASAINIASYCTDDFEDGAREKCRAKLYETLMTSGFALIRGTGMSGSTCRDCLRSAKSFLHEADEAVRRSTLTKDRARRGYSPICTENFASLVGKKGPNDLVKKFRMGSEAKSSSCLHQTNVWPDATVWGEKEVEFFKTSIGDYYCGLCKVAESVLQAICEGITANDPKLKKPLEAIVKPCNDSNKPLSESHTSILTLLGYQPGTRHKRGSKGFMKPLVAAHTDVGVITVLLFDSGECASLQRAEDASSADPENSTWLDVDLPSIPADDPIFVVNVADCLSELSAGAVRSTLHRVVPRPFGDSKICRAVRTCLALFVGLEPNDCLTLPSGENMTYEEWRKKRIAKATSAMKE